MNKFKSIYQFKSDTELIEIANDKETFQEEARMAARELLEERNVSIGSNELEGKAFETDKSNIYQGSVEDDILKVRDKYVTNDESAPLLYSQELIMLFCILFSPIYGSVLVMMNMRTIGKKKAGSDVFLYGVFYSIFLIFLGSRFNIPYYLYLLPHAGVGMFFNKFFWDNYIGKETLYRKRSWVMPVVLSIIISLGLFSIVFLLFNQSI